MPTQPVQQTQGITSDNRLGGVGASDGDKLVDSRPESAGQAKVAEVVIVRHNGELTVPVDLDLGVQLGGVFEQIVERGLLRNGEAAAQAEPQSGDLLAPAGAELGLQRDQVGVAGQFGWLLGEDPLAGAYRLDLHSGAVDVDDQHIPGICLAPRRDLRRTGVPDAVADPERRVPVTEHGELDPAVVDSGAQPRLADGGRIVPIGIEAVDLPMADEDPGRHGVPRERGDRLRDEVGQRPLGEPGRGHQLDRLGQVQPVRAGLVQHVHVIGTATTEFGRGVDRSGIEWIVVAGQQEHRDRESAEHFEGLGQHFAVELIGLEDVTADDRESGVALGRDSADAIQDVEPCLGVTRSRIVVEERRGHAELPIGTGDESQGNPPDRTPGSTPDIADSRSALRQPAGAPFVQRIPITDHQHRPRGGRILADTAVTCRSAVPAVAEFRIRMESVAAYAYVCGVTNDSYLRYPHIGADSIAFVAENDIWLTGTDGGRAYRISSDHMPVKSPRISPDGTRIAWSATNGGLNEVYVAPIDGGTSTRLTYWAQRNTFVRGWLSDAEVLVVSTRGEADRERMFAHAVPINGEQSRRLPYGWAHELVFGPDGGTLLSTSGSREAAWWKRYRGGTAAQLWLDADGDGEFKRIFADLPSPLESPLWVDLADGRQRIGFLSDHEGSGQLYSATIGKRAPTTSRLVRHTDHPFYARHATSDGRRVVYVSGGELYVLDSLAPDAEPHRVDVTLTGGRSTLRPHRVPASADVATLSPDRTGRASALESRGTIHWLTHRDGPARTLADSPGVRRRLPVLLGDSARVAWVTDADGDDAIVVGSADDDTDARTLIPAGRVGRVLELSASPDGRRIAIASHDGRLLTASVPAGGVTRAARVTEVDDCEFGDVSGLAFSPDSRWLAWSAPGREPLRQIKLTKLTRPGSRSSIIDVTPLRFSDSEPVFTADGSHLAFLSVRSLDPVYDSVVFDLAFPNGCRPHIVPLSARTPSPFEPLPGGRATSEQSEDDKPGEPPETVVDLEHLHARITPVPVAGGRYSGLRAVQGGLIWLAHPLTGTLGDDRPRLEDAPERARLEHLALDTGKVQVLIDAVDEAEPSGDGRFLVVRDRDSLLVVPATRKVPAEDTDGDRITVDLDRVRVEVDPRAEWRQMYHEAWRLMRDHYWRPDMSGVDWDGMRAKYAPALERIASHDDLVDLIWELHGELGSSHAYCIPAPDHAEHGTQQGLLGADLEYADGAWRIARIVPGESSEPRARSPLTAPGVAARDGDSILAIDGRPTGPTRSPGSLLVGTADKPVELTIAAPDGSDRRNVVVVPLADEFPLRYQDWVDGRRRWVHEHSDDRIGYVHVPDMMSPGWAQLHRDLRTEFAREALIVDVRGNNGGHTSQLIVEKLARKILGWDLVREGMPESYPQDARRGPLVTVTDMYAGSDGDIVTAAIRSLRLGPVVGTRTWGGVVGIDGRYQLVDGTAVTQPRFSFWFEEFGWGVENYGVDPDVEVVTTPQDRVSGADPQLERALGLALDELIRTPAAQPPELPPL